MKQSTEMTRWTKPVNTDFFALHKGAINLYSTFAIIAQAVWLIFSTKVLAVIISDNTGLPHNYAIWAAYTSLAFLHYQLHELLKYIFFNKLDNDPNTVNSSFHYLVAAAIVVGMLFLDIQGTTAFFRESEKFTELASKNDTRHGDLTAQIDTRYSADAAAVNNATNLRISSVRSLYEQKIASAKLQKNFDEWDVKAKARKIAALKAEMSGKIAQINTHFADESTALLSAKNAALGSVTNDYRDRAGRIISADEANANKAGNYGYVISLFCLLILLGCTYQTTTLRVLAGQKPVSRLTISDATGSVGSKFSDATVDIFQRWAHMVIFHYHRTFTHFAKELDSLDGSFKLDGVEYRANGSAQGSGGGATQSPPPPPPTTPPGNNGGGNGGDGGGNAPDKLPPVHYSTIDTGSQVAYCFNNLLETVFELNLPAREDFVEWYNEEHLQTSLLSVDALMNRETEKVGYDEGYKWDIVRLNYSIHPDSRTAVRNALLNMFKIKDLILDLAKTADEEGLIRGWRWSQTTETGKLEYLEFLKKKSGLTLDVLGAACEKINPTDNDLDKVIELAKKLATASPLLAQKITEPENIDIAVPQHNTALAQQKPEKLSVLDDTLLLIRSNLLKEGKEQFKRNDAKVKSVVTRVFDNCDKAFLALKQKGEVSTYAIKKLRDVLIEKLALCEEWGHVYDSREILEDLLNSRAEAVKG